MLYRQREVRLSLAATRLSVQVYLAHKKQCPPREDPTVGLCLGLYGGPRVGGCFLLARFPYEATLDAAGQTLAPKL